MDCKTAQSLADFLRPGAAELPPADAAAVEDHLADCPVCGPGARAARQFDAAVGRAVRDVRLPAGLRERLLDTLERDRRAAGRPARRAAAVAAGLLALAGVVGVWQYRSAGRPLLDPEAVGQRVEADNSLRNVKEWLSAQGVGEPPQPLNFALVAYRGVADFQDRPAPMLLLVNGRQFAHVYAARAADFDLSAVAGQNRARTSQFKVEVLAGPRGDSRVWVVVMSAEAVLEMFLAQDAVIG